MNELQILQERVRILEEFIYNLQKSSSIPLYFQQALEGRGFIRSGGNISINVSEGGTGATSLSGILKGNGIYPFTAIPPLSGNNTVWVAATSGGATTKGLNFTDGVLVSFS